MQKATLVGIFFQIDGELLVDAVPATDAEPYGRAIQHGGHYEYWAALQPTTGTQRRFKRRDYDVYPRGRVVLFPDRGQYRVYLDRCLTTADRRAIISAFGLHDQPVEFETCAFGTPAAARARSSVACSSLSVRARPLYTPRRFAAAMPSACLSLINAFSNAATTSGGVVEDVFAGAARPELVDAWAPRCAESWWTGDTRGLADISVRVYGYDCSDGSRGDLHVDLGCRHEPVAHHGA